MEYQRKKLGTRHCGRNEQINLWQPTSAIKILPLMNGYAAYRMTQRQHRYIVRHLAMVFKQFLGTGWINQVTALGDVIQ